MTAKETAPFAPDAVNVITKESITRSAALNLHPDESCRRIHAGAEEAVRRVAAGGVQAPAIDKPVTLDLEFQTGDMAEVATWARDTRAHRRARRQDRRRQPAERLQVVCGGHLHHPAGRRTLSTQRTLTSQPDDRKTIAMKIFEAAPPEVGPSLALHGGAGGRVEELTLEGRAPYAEGLQAAFSAGWRVLAAGGSALDAVCASVEVLENDPLFNAGRGAALTATGHAELDASVMTGAGLAGAVAASKYAKNPVWLARTVMEQHRPRAHRRPGCRVPRAPRH